VGGSGFETIPVVGRIRVAGLTTRELELDLKERLRTMGILEDAEVQVTLVETHHTQFSILGSVQRPGTYALPTPDYRLLNALAEAGGLPPQIEKIYVFRRWGVHGGAVEAPATTMPHHDSNVVSFTMSDVSTSSASAPSASAPNSMPTQETTRPSPPAAPVDELKILEGAPTTEPVAPRWDPQKGEWVIERLPTAPAAREGEPSPFERLARPATSTAPEEKPAWEAAEELSPATRILEIPTKELLDGDPRYNIVIRPYDLISVPPGNVGEYYMMGNVARPGAYELTGRKLTVKEAVASGGGFGPLAWPARADLVRRIGKDEEQMIQLDLDAVFAGNAPDFYLKPNDIVNVGTHPVATFLAVLRNAFRVSYGFGFVYDRNFADSDTAAAREQAKQRRLQKAQLRGLPIN
jgi:polysaccharide export outer membrane protein